MSTTSSPEEAKEIISSLGTKQIQELFDVTPGCVSNWKRRGLPRTVRKILLMTVKDSACRERSSSDENGVSAQ